MFLHWQLCMRLLQQNWYFMENLYLNKYYIFLLYPAIKNLDLEEESVSLQAFDYLKTSSHRCLCVSEGITAIIDIFEACDEIAHLKRTCEQFGLTVCLKVVVFSVGGCYSNQFLVLPASCCIQSLYLLEATPTRGHNYWA